MAMGVCRECNKAVSSEAKACPSCGAADPFKPKRIGVLGWLGVGFVGLLAFTMCTPRDDASTAVTAKPTGSGGPPPKSESQIALEKRLALQSLKPNDLRPILANELQALCTLINPSLNYIKGEVRGTAIYCVHTFYNEHSLKVGRLGPAMSAWAQDWTAELRHAGVKRVGVYGTGEYASGSWFVLD